MDIKRNPGGPGWMVRYDNDTFKIFDSQMEAIANMAKIETARAIVAAVKTLTTVNDIGPDLVVEFFHAGIFTDDDVAPLGITATQLVSCITLLQQSTFLMSGANDGAGHSAITPGDYTATLNAVRRVTG